MTHTTTFVWLQVEMEQGFGERCSVDLLPGGANVPVTRGNVSHYCELYAQHLLVHSIQKQFAAFHRGFLRLCSGAALQLFRCVWGVGWVGGRLASISNVFLGVRAGGRQWAAFYCGHPSM